MVPTIKDKKELSNKLDVQTKLLQKNKLLV